MYSSISSKIYIVKKIMSGSAFFVGGPKSADLPRRDISDPRQSRG